MVNKINIFSFSEEIEEEPIDEKKELSWFVEVIQRAGRQNDLTPDENERIYSLLEWAELSGNDNNCALKGLQNLGLLKGYFDRALMVGDEKTALKLIKMGAIKSSEEAQEAFYDACFYGVSSVIELFLKIPTIKLDKRDAKGRTPLTAVCGSLESIEKIHSMLFLLIGVKADVNIPDSNGNTPLHLLCAKGITFISLIKLLLHHGANADAQDKKGQTPLMKVIQKRGSLHLAELLIDHSKNINAFNKEGKNVLYQVLESREGELTFENRILINALIEAGANIHRINGFCALKMAINQKSVETIELLLDTSEENAKNYLNQAPRKIQLTHVNSLKGDFEEANPGKMLAFIREVIKTLPPELSNSMTNYEKQQLEEAFDLPDSRILPSLQDGKLSILPLGYPGHSVYLVFCRGYMVICNRGSGLPQDKKTMDAHRIHPALFTEEILKHLHHIKAEGSREEFIHYYYYELPRLLSPNKDKHPVKDEVCRQLEKLSPGLQKSAVCTYTSGKLAVRAASAMLKIRPGLPQSELSNTDLEAARRFSKKVSLHARLTVLNDCYKEGIDGGELEQAHQKTMKHIRRTRFISLDRYPNIAARIKRKFWSRLPSSILQYIGIL